VDGKRRLSVLHRSLIDHGAAQLALFEGLDREAAKRALRFLGDERVDPVYTHPGLCLTVLPHRELPAGQEWIRRTGYATLLVQPIKGTDARMRGVPFGVKARLILLYLMTEAVKTRSRHIELGRSMRGWLASMGVPICGKNYRMVGDQADRIEHCLLTFQLTNEGGQAAVRDGIIRGSFRAFPSGEEREFTTYAIELSEAFYAMIVRHPVPLVESAIRALADTCMPLDLYLWLTYRLHVLDRPILVPWPALHTQFGAGTALLKHFKPRLARDLRLALAVYPEGRAELGEHGLTLYPSPPPVPARLITASGR
jgi:hypothetical protein